MDVLAPNESVASTVDIPEAALNSIFLSKAKQAATRDMFQSSPLQNSGISSTPTPNASRSTPTKLSLLRNLSHIPRSSSLLKSPHYQNKERIFGGRRASLEGGSQQSNLPVILCSPQESVVRLNSDEKATSIINEKVITRKSNEESTPFPDLTPSRSEPILSPRSILVSRSNTASPDSQHSKKSISSNQQPERPKSVTWNETTEIHEIVLMGSEEQAWDTASEDEDESLQLASESEHGTEGDNLSEDDCDIPKQWRMQGSQDPLASMNSYYEMKEEDDDLHSDDEDMDRVTAEFAAWHELCEMEEYVKDTSTESRGRKPSPLRSARATAQNNLEECGNIVKLEPSLNINPVFSHASHLKQWILEQRVGDADQQAIEDGIEENAQSESCLGDALSGFGTRSSLGSPSSNSDGEEMHDCIETVEDDVDFANASSASTPTLQEAPSDMDSVSDGLPAFPETAQEVLSIETLKDATQLPLDPVRNLSPSDALFSPLRLHPAETNTDDFVGSMLGAFDRISENRRPAEYRVVERNQLVKANITGATLRKPTGSPNSTTANEITEAFKSNDQKVWSPESNPQKGGTFARNRKIRSSSAFARSKIGAESQKEKFGRLYVRVKCLKDTAISEEVPAVLRCTLNGDDVEVFTSSPRRISRQTSFMEEFAIWTRSISELNFTLLQKEDDSKLRNGLNRMLNSKRRDSMSNSKPPVVLSRAKLPIHVCASSALETPLLIQVDCMSDSMADRRRGSVNPLRRLNGSQVSLNPLRRVGTWEVQTLFIETSTDKIEMPKDMDACLKLVENKAWHAKTRHQGTMSQSGGDCQHWRRRFYKLVGSNLCAYHDAHRTPRVQIDLTKAIRLCADGKTIATSAAGSKNAIALPPSRFNEDTDAAYVNYSFRIDFTNGETIEFSCDTEQDKKDWLQVLCTLLTNPIPELPHWITDDYVLFYAFRSEYAFLVLLGPWHPITSGIDGFGPGWDRTVISAAVAVLQLFWGLGQPVIVFFAERKFGFAKTIFIASFVYAMGCIIMAFSGRLPGLFIFACGILVGGGAGGNSFPIVLASVGRRFVAKSRQQATAFGIVSSFGSFGQCIFLPLSNALIGVVGWHWTFIILGILTFLVSYFSIFLTTIEPRRLDDQDLDASRDDEKVETKTDDIPKRNSLLNPDEDLEANTHELPDPTMHTLESDKQHNYTKPEPMTIGAALKEAATSLAFWLVTLGFAVCGYHVAFLGTHLPAYLDDQGIPQSIGAWTISVIGFGSMCGTILSGWLCSRIRPKYILSFIYIVRGILMIAFLFSKLSLSSTFVFAAFFGVFWLSTVPPTTALVGQIFGQRYLGTLSSLTYIGHQVGAFLGSFLGGVEYDSTGSYNGMWYSSLALAVIGCLVNFAADDRSLRR